MAISIAKKFLVVERKYFNFKTVGRKVEGLEVCENKRGIWVSINFCAEEVEWLVNSSQGFYWGEGKGSW